MLINRVPTDLLCDYFEIMDFEKEKILKRVSLRTFLMDNSNIVYMEDAEFSDSRGVVLISKFIQREKAIGVKLEKRLIPIEAFE